MHTENVLYLFFSSEIRYPSPLDSDFFEQVYYDARYYQKGLTEYDKSEGTFEINDQQRQFPRYFSPITGIKSALLFHNVGSGKSGTIILSLFQRRHIHDRPALLLVPNENIAREFQYEILGREWISSGEEGKCVFRRKFTGDAFVNAEMRDILNNMESERAKEAMCKLIWDKHVAPLIEIQTHNRFDMNVLGGATTKKDAMEDNELIRVYSNRDIVVDECQKMRKEKRLYQALKTVIEKTTGTTLLLCSATPMIESAKEICATLNLLLIHDGVAKKDLITPEIIEAYTERNDEKAHEQLIIALKGRVSFVRGMHPDFFPLREDHGESVFPDQPSHRVWPCYMTGRQLKAYLEAFQIEFVPNSEAGQRNDVWNKTGEKARVHILPTMGKISQNTGQFVANLNSPDWKVENMQDLSCKNVEMHKITTEFHPKDGPALIYFAKVITGVKPNETFWRANGVVEWNPKVSQKGTNAFVNISGEARTGMTNIAIKALKSDRNYKSGIIRYSLASPKVSIGLTMRHHSIGIVSEVSWTRGEIEQLLGRLTRHMSHVHCSDPDANKIVHAYILCAKIRPQDINAINDIMFIKRWNTWFEQNLELLTERGFINTDGSLRTLDERTLEVGLIRDAAIAKISRLLKEISIPLNLAQNFFPKEGKRYSMSRLNDYLSAPPNIPVPNEYSPTAPDLVASVPTIVDETFISADAWWFHCATTEESVDFFGHIRKAIFDILKDKHAITINDLIIMASRQSGYSHVDVGLVLSKLSCPVNVNMETGWVYWRLEGAIDPLLWWQQSPGVEMITSDRWNEYIPPEPIRGLGFLMQDHTCLEDIFGSIVEQSEPKISDNFDRRYMQSDGKGLISLLRETTSTVSGWCGIYENTPDGADEYSLKIVMRNGTRQSYSKISAHSKSIAGLIELTMELDGDTEDILNSNKKKTTACDLIADQLERYGRFLPWMPDEHPTLFRMLIISRQWNLFALTADIERFVSKLVTSGAFLGLCKKLFIHRRSTTLVHHVISDERITSQIENGIREKRDYVARIIERISRNRPKKFNTQQWTEARNWITDNVLNAGVLNNFYQTLEVEFQKRLTGDTTVLVDERPMKRVKSR